MCTFSEDTLIHIQEATTREAGSTKGQTSPEINKQYGWSQKLTNETKVRYIEVLI